MSPDWPKVSKNERHGYEEPAAAPPPAPEGATDFWLEYYKDAPHFLPSQAACEFAEAYAAHLQAELAAIQKRRAEISATWGHVDGKTGCQCPICQSDFDAFLDVFQDIDMQLNLPGGYKDRAEAAEARCRVLEEALRAMFDAAKTAIGNTHLPSEWHEKSPMALAERALAGQEK